MTARSVETVLVGLGSNLGDKRNHLLTAVRRIAALPEVSDVRTGRIWQTPPWGGPPGQGAFLNAALCCQVTAIEPRALLDRLLEFERLAGRLRGERNGPRTLDLDILIWDRRIVEVEGLRIPHARMHERPFVLLPAADVASDLVHPGLRTTVGALASACVAGGEFTIVEEANWHHAVTHS